MSDSGPQLALRELRREFSRPATFVVVAGIAAILAVVGPFGTDELLRLAPRAVYWFALVAASYAAGALCSGLARLAVSGQWPRLALAGFLTGMAVCAIVFLVNWLTFGFLPDADQLPGYFGPIFAIAWIVTALAQYLSAQAVRETTVAPPILDRLPLDKRGALVALSVEDHYVRVRTTKGEEMLLMRLSDAIGETGTTPGARVHRSHWAAFEQVRAARREGDRAVLTMHDGSEIPVSRANVPTIREAGLLPR